MGVADAGQHGRDMPIRSVERRPALGIIPGERRKPPLDRRDRIRLAIGGRRAGGAGGDVEADGLRRRRQDLEALAPAPGGKVLPVRRIGPAGVGRARGVDIAAGALGQAREMRRQAGGRKRGGEAAAGRD